MSKRSVKMNQTRKPVKTGARPAARSTSARQASAKPVVKKPVNGKPLSMKGRTHVKTGPEVNLQAVRIVAGVVALICAAGVTAALVQRSVTTVDPERIILMLLLGIIIGFSVFTAINPQVVVDWTGRLSKR